MVGGGKLGLSVPLKLESERVPVLVCDAPSYQSDAQVVADGQPVKVDAAMTL